MITVRREEWGRTEKVLIVSKWSRAITIEAIVAEPEIPILITNSKSTCSQIDRPSASVSVKILWPEVCKVATVNVAGKVAKATPTDIPQITWHLLKLTRPLIEVSVDISISNYVWINCISVDGISIDCVAIVRVLSINVGLVDVDLNRISIANVLPISVRVRIPVGLGTVGASAWIVSVGVASISVVTVSIATISIASRKTVDNGRFAIGSFACIGTCAV